MERLRDRYENCEPRGDPLTRPRFAIAEYTTPSLTFADDLALYREIGADGIGIDETKLDDTNSAVEQLRKSGLQTAGFFPAIPSILPLPNWAGPDDPAARIELLCEGVRRAAAYQPACYVCITGPAGEHSTAAAREIVVDGFRSVAQAAADAGVTVGLEAIHASIQDDWTLVTTIPEMVELLDEIDSPGMAMAFDLWHLWDTPDFLHHVETQAKRCVHVHLDDWREPTRSWCDRTLPGDGVADARGFLKALAAGGFDGWVDLEIFSDDGRFGNDFPDSLWKLDPRELVEAGRDRFLSLWSDGDAATAESETTQQVYPPLLERGTTR
jgi:sugar phosphate isomerase/epimerase